MFIASLRTSGAVAAVFLLLTLTFLFLCIGALRRPAPAGPRPAAGSASPPRSLAWYASFAAVTNSTFKRVVLPVFPLARA